MRILYVNYNPATLIRDEQLLMRAGYEVNTVFGADGLLACGSVAEYSSVLIDNACPLEARNKLVSWLTPHFAGLNVLTSGPLISASPGFLSLPASNDLLPHMGKIAL